MSRSLSERSETKGRNSKRKLGPIACERYLFRSPSDATHVPFPERAQRDEGAATSRARSVGLHLGWVGEDLREPKNVSA